MTETITRAPLRGQVRARLVEGLLRGSPAPGSSINESALSASIGVSRTPLREALLALEREGLVSYSPGRGFFVRPLDAAEAAELYPVLWTLEALALRTAALRPAADLDALDELNRRLRAAGDLDATLALDARWHEALAAPCPNRRLLEMLASMRAQAFRYEFAFASDTGHPSASPDPHEALTASLRTGNLASSVETIERHWRASLDQILPWLERRAAR